MQIEISGIENELVRYFVKDFYVEEMKLQTKFFLELIMRQNEFNYGGYQNEVILDKEIFLLNDLREMITETDSGLRKKINYTDKKEIIVLTDENN